MLKPGTLITGVQKYYSDLSVTDKKGLEKVSLLELDDGGAPTGNVVTLDATTSVDVSMSNKIMEHSAESKKVYMDGTKVNPIKMSIRGHLDIQKLSALQSFARGETWVFVSMVMDMGGALVTMPIGETAHVFCDTKPYTIQDLSLTDSGFKNTVEFTMTLSEVVLFEYGVDYVYSVNPNTEKTQTTTVKDEEKKMPPMANPLRDGGEK